MWMGLSVAAAGFGLSWLFLILAVAVLEGLCRTLVRRFHPDDAAARQRRRPAERDRRQLDHDGHRRRRRHAARHAGRHLSGRIRPLCEARLRRSLHQRHPAQRAVDRHRPVRLSDCGGADGPFLGHCRRHRAGGAGGSGRRSHHRGHAEPGSQRVARSRRRRSACRVRSSFSASATARRGRAC